MMEVNRIEKQAQGALLDCLQNIPFLTTYPIIDRNGDFRMMVDLDNTQKTIIAEVKNNGEPRYARQAANQLIRYLQNSPEAYGIFIAPYISPQAAEICREANIGFVDFAGNCFISFGNVFIQRKGEPNPFTRNRSLRSLYSPKSERILRVMLENGPKKWKVTELAEEADVSLGLVSKVKKLLTDREWVDSKNVGFSLTAPFPLLEEWSQNYSYRRNQVQGFYSLQSIQDIETSIDEICKRNNLRYAITGFSGAARLAPMVRYQQVMTYVENKLEQITETLDLKSVSSGANVILLSPYDEGIFYGEQNVAGLEIVSSTQLYLDLKNYRGRGEEAAQAILDEVIRKKW